MKKLLFFATALLVLASCNNKDNALNNAPEGTPFKKGQQVTLTVGTGNNANPVAPRKVAGIDNTAENRIEFTWEEGDQILVKVGDKSAEFTLNSTPGYNYGDFVGTMPADGSTFDIQYTIEAPDLSMQVYTAEKTIPADKMLFTATNCTLGNTATLYAQYAMVQLNLYGTDKTVGKIVFTNKTASPAVSYTLTCTEGVEIGTASASATPFYMVVPAGEYKFEVEVWNAATTPAKICAFATSAAKTFVAGQCLNMPAQEVDPYNGHAYVDLGLSVKWATCNVGATKAEEYGDYFAWGEIEPYYSSQDPLTWKEGKTSGYAWVSYFDTNDGGNTFIKYNLTGGKTVLELADDAARQNWGGAWRMPTYAEWDELKTGCTWTPTTLNSISGYEVEGPNGNTIFLPASGCRSDLSLDDVGSCGDYWSSSLFANDAKAAHYLGFDSDHGVSWKLSIRDFGRSVRPVCQ